MSGQSDKADEIALEDFPFRAMDTIRYGDTDRQGHVNNAVFATFLESGRVRLLYDPANPLADSGAAFVIARLMLDFRAEIAWPGEVAIGTRVAAVGRSSMTLEQGLFQNRRCVAKAQTIIVQMDEATRQSRPLSEAAKRRLAAFMEAAPEAGSASAE